MCKILPAILALEETGQTFTEHAIGGKLVGKVGTFSHSVTREMERDAVTAAALEFHGRTVGALPSAAAWIRPEYRSSGKTLTRNLHAHQE